MYLFNIISNKGSFSNQICDLVASSCSAHMLWAYKGKSRRQSTVNRTQCTAESVSQSVKPKYRLLPQDGCIMCHQPKELDANLCSFVCAHFSSALTTNQMVGWLFTFWNTATPNALGGLYRVSTTSNNDRKAHRKP